MRRGTALALLLVLLLQPAGLYAQADRPWTDEGQKQQKKVLVIYTTRRDLQFSIVGDQTLPALLERELDRKVAYYSEHIDGTRFDEAEYVTAFHDYLAIKYRDIPLDVVIGMNELAFRFLSTHRDRLFPGTPVVFLSDTPGPGKLPNSTGIVTERNYRATIDLARALQPDTRDVYVVVGNSDRDRAVEHMARAQFASYSPGLQFTFLSGLSTDALERRLRSMPERAIVYYLAYFQDAAGITVTPLDYLDRVLAIANRPVYSWVDRVDQGIIGGGIASIRLQVEAVARLAARVLRGEPADSIPNQTPPIVEAQVDWRQLQRWGISESRVPDGTRVLFRTQTPWERYRLYVIGVGAVVLTQTGLLVLLFAQRRRLRLAEETVRHGQVDLAVSRQRIRDLGGRLLAAQDAERSRIAMELHDEISQQLAVVTMNLQMLCGFGSSRDEEAEAVAREALDHADRVSRSLRDLSHRLFPAKLRLLGLIPAIASLEHDLSAPGLAVRFTHDNVPPTLPHDLTLALFRVVQEALRNAIAHSEAQEVRVHLEGRGSALFLTVADDGVGFDPTGPTGEGLGLISMRERLDVFGGALTIKSTPGGGTRIEVVIPEVDLRAASVAV